jgi:ubiquinone/menaquinone biosynthesis C-methylase UbiE
VVRPDAQAGRELRDRYSASDLQVFTEEEKSRFVHGWDSDPRTDPVLAWELLYRLEPHLYDRLATAEHLHPAILSWLPQAADTIVEVAAGTGRLTLELLDHGREVVAVEPALPLREILQRKLADTDRGGRARVVHGFFDDLPLPANAADLVVACSAITRSPAHGGDVGLSEMERVCTPGGCVAIIWPNDMDWLAGHGYEYVSFGGPMAVEFRSHEEAIELTEIFFPAAAEAVRQHGLRRVPFEVLGINPPCDLAFKTLTS